MFRTYKEYIEPSLSQYKEIIIDSNDIAKITEFVNKVIAKKKSEPHHKVDSHNEFKRFYTGTLGEAAIEKLLNIQGIIDWTIGDSSYYNEADLRNIGLNIGVKTVEYGSFPIVHKNVMRPEIINLRIGNNKILVCGIATISVLNSYQDDDLIKSPSLRARGTKSGFYGFKDLLPFSSINDLKQYIGK